MLKFSSKALSNYSKTNRAISGYYDKPCSVASQDHHKHPSSHTNFSTL